MAQVFEALCGHFFNRGEHPRHRARMCAAVRFEYVGKEARLAHATRARQQSERDGLISEQALQRVKLELTTDELPSVIERAVRVLKRRKVRANGLPWACFRFTEER